MFISISSAFSNVRTYSAAAMAGTILVLVGSLPAGLAAENDGENKVNANQETSPTLTADHRLPELPKAITSFGAAVLDDAVYVYGGHHGRPHHYSREDQSGELLRLDLKSGSAWEVISTGPKLQGLALVAHGGNLYRIGGFTARNDADEDQDPWSVADFARFDVKTRKWQDLSPMPSPRSSFDAVVVDDTLYVVGGWELAGDQEEVWQQAAYSADLSQPAIKWKTLKKPPFERRALSVGALNHRVYAVGGMQSSGQITTATAIYDPSADQWTEGPAIPGSGLDGFGSSCFALADRLYVSTASGSLLRLSDDGRAWQVEEKLDRGRFFHRMLAINPQHLVMLGGASMVKGRFSEVDLIKVK